jgi:hypothetical protein
MQAFADGDQRATRSRELGQPDPSRQLAADGVFINGSGSSSNVGFAGS